jgi:hypothetical protein
VEGDITLPIPHIAALYQEDTSAQTLAKDGHLIEELEEVVMCWESHVTKAVENYVIKVTATGMFGSFLRSVQICKISRFRV